MRKTILRDRIDARQHFKQRTITQTGTITFWGRAGVRMRNKFLLRSAVYAINRLHRTMRYRRLTPAEEDALARYEEVVRSVIRDEPELADPYRAWLLLNGFHTD